MIITMFSKAAVILLVLLVSSAKGFMLNRRDIEMEPRNPLFANNTQVTVRSNVLNVTKFSQCMNQTEDMPIAVYRTEDLQHYITYSNTSIVELLSEWLKCLEEQGLDTELFVIDHVNDFDDIIDKFEPANSIIAWEGQHHYVPHTQLSKRGSGDDVNIYWGAFNAKNFPCCILARSGNFSHGGCQIISSTSYER